MEWFNLPLVALLLLLSFWLLLRRHRGDRPDRAKPLYQLDAELFSEQDSNFLAALEQALGDRYRVLCKVGIAGMIAPRDGLDRRRGQRAAEAICDRQFGFLLCSRDSLKPLCVIELDEPGGQTGDPLLDRVCQDAGLPLLRFPWQRTWVPAEIGLRIDQLFEPSAFSTVVPDGSETQQAQGLLGPARPAEPECPDCGAPMTKRQTRGDFQVEQDFWLCGLPECRKRIPLERNDRKRPSALDGLVP